MDNKEEALIQRSIIEELRQKIEGSGKTFCVITFGCQMNAKDSEKLTGILRSIGYIETDSEDADFVIYNTCTVRENANLKVYGRLGYLKKLKEKDPDKIIALCGCMMQEDAVVEKIKKSYRFVDIIFGTHNIFKLPELIKARMNSKGMIIDIWQGTDRIVEDLPICRKYSFKMGINIMFGCDNFCSYCIVPYVRGRERSRDPEDIIAEIKKNVADGVVEIMLLGQNVNSYGKGLDKDITFAQLLERVAEIPGLKRVRFMTSHPKDFSPELISVIARHDNICKHIHLPLQSGSSKLLKDMNRKYTKEKYLALVDSIRKEIPDVSLTTDIIVGFPTETEEDFQETLDVVEKVGYDSAYTFIYSRRSNTPAARMENAADEETIKNRFDRLLSLVSEKGNEAVKRFEGRVMDVIPEDIDKNDPDKLSGRTEHNIVVHFDGTPDLIGKIVKVKLCECKGFYYMGSIVKE